MPEASSFHLIGAELRVSSLKRSLELYSGILGLASQSEGSGRVGLRTAPGEPILLTLTEVPGVSPAPEDAAGLFHLAYLVPDRPSLARVLLRLAEKEWPLQGLSDHGVSEAIYLSDPDGNGLELYADRPRSRWPRKEGGLDMFTQRLDIPDLLALAPDRRGAGLPKGTCLGHVHLRVTNLAPAERFYTKELGLDVTVRGYPGALFYSAGGYHHHIATNTWGVRLPKPAGDHAGLIRVRAAVDGLPEPKVIADPDGNTFALEPA